MLNNTNASVSLTRIKRTRLEKKELPPSSDQVPDASEMQIAMTNTGHL